MKEETNSASNKLDDDMLNNNYLFLFTRPDLYLFTIKIEELIDSITYDIETKDMSYDIAYAYSFDDGHTWSRYYLNEEEDKFLQLVRDYYSKQFNILIKVRLETDLTKEGDYETSNIEDAYFVKVLSFKLNDKDVKIESQYVVNATGITLQKHSQLFDPYANMDAAFNIQEQLAISINHMFGHWVYYFKTEPDEESRNVTLKSYTLHNVIAMKKIKISVPDNKLPDSRNIYSEWGISLPDEFNVHIMNDTFERAFGIGSYPHQHDYLYLPLTGMMYEINSAYENKKFMHKSLWNECVLVKYEDDKIVNKDEYEDDTFDYIELVEDGGLTTKEEEEQQEADPNYLNIKLLEYFRLLLHKQTEIVNYELYNNRLKLFDNMYLFSAVPVNEIGVAFDCKHTLLDNASINFWFGVEKLIPQRCILQCINTNKEKILTLELSKNVLKLTYNKIVLWSSIEIQPNKRYACSISLSNMYQYMELILIDYDESNQSITKIIESIKIDIPTTAYALDRLELLGGKTLIGNIGLDNVTYSIDDVTKRLTLVTPTTKTNVFFDKAAIPISDQAINGY